MFKSTLYVVSAFLILFTSIANADDITDYWSNSNEKNSQTIDHTAWDNILRKYINIQNDNKFRYSTVSKNDRDSLKSYIKKQARINPLTYNKAEQFAYWVNLYNALTIDTVLDHYPVSSIKKIKLGGFFSSGPWKASLVTINEQALSLDDIEHRILRPIWKDPRAHYAVNCASIGCPNLANRAFTSANTNSLLSKNAKAFINSDKGLMFDGNKLILSKIYSWFKEDFGTQKNKVFNHISQYADPERMQLLKSKNLNVNYRYNWDLNDDK